MMGIPLGRTETEEISYGAEVEWSSRWHMEIGVKRDVPVLLSLDTWRQMPMLGSHEKLTKHGTCRSQ